MEELQKKHRAEQRDLQARIMQKKKSATKKTRKGVNEECLELERQLHEKQNGELSQLHGDNNVVDDETSTGAANDIITSEKRQKEHVDSHLERATEPIEEEARVPDTSSESQSRKPNRQKARLARRVAEQEASAAQAAKEAENLPDLREQELSSMAKELEKRSLQMKSIPSDGHCLYSAVADQLLQRDLSLNSDAVAAQGPSYKIVRAVAADYMSNHPDDFIPFLEEPLEEYVKKIRDTGEWGGHLELSALANAYKLKINVLQSNGRVENIEARDSALDQPIWLGYYRHSFGLGEHYNSLRSR